MPVLEEGIPKVSESKKRTTRHYLLQHDLQPGAPGEKKPAKLEWQAFIECCPGCRR